MQLTYRPYHLQLKHPFTIAKFTRTATPVMLVTIEHEGYTGHGEASMVPYMGESHETAAAFLSKVDVSRLIYPFDFGAIINYLDDIAPGNPAIKAAIDIALHDLDGKLRQTPCWQLLGSEPALMPPTSYTIGIDTPDVVRQKVLTAPDVKVLKVKLGRENDRELIEAIRSVSNLPLYADANQGWTDRQQALDMILWLHGQGVQLIEQPMNKLDVDGNAWLTEQSPIPVIGDEAVQRLPDVALAAGIYHGINIKLMKSAGMYESLQIIKKARSLGLKILIGSMSETSCATLAAAALAPQCDWADLDGPLLTTNNPYVMPGLNNGRWQLSSQPGLGVI
ncbi:dipeptide epimerase [Mucilaginibacter sp. UR6-1]|uniref:dipeptide epimerase n=1 Tax=Mucilaginibacter sp. UR6-1 TaxID=1435643 RepID=UPI001E476E9A|nr:dipeptide epimerase [Mucilaginibacter sp. UR6-1]MCC8410353.1 dipeptide epimerase [Mucilaginibacter sp. UR6-1]